MGKSISLKKIAQLAHVSTATVSRALHGLPGVSDEKRREIETIVKSIGIPRQRTSRTARGGCKSPSKGKTICLLQTYSDHMSATELFVRQLQSITKRAAQYGMDVVVSFCNQAEQLPLCVREKRVAGMLVFGGKVSDSVAQCIEEIPSVWMASHSKLPRSLVMEGNQSAGELAAEYLIGKGHRHLAGFYLYEHHVMDIRLNAFATHAAANGADAVRITSEGAPRKEGEQEHLWYRALWQSALDRWAALKPRPTGIFSPDDMLTAYLYPELAKRGIKVGQDMEIISFGNKVSFLAGLEPRPATIDIGPEAMGRQAVDLLRAEIAQPTQERSINISIQPMLVKPEGV